MDRNTRTQRIVHEGARRAGVGTNVETPDIGELSRAAESPKSAMGGNGGMTAETLQRELLDLVHALYEIAKGLEDEQKRQQRRLVSLEKHFRDQLQLEVAQ